VVIAQPPKGKIVSSPVLGSDLPGKEFKLEVIPADGKLIGLQVNVGKWQQFENVVRGVKFVHQDAAGKQRASQVGPCDGDWQKAVEIPAGVLVVGVSGSYGLVMDSLQFHFSDGTKTPRFGGKAGDLDFQFAVKEQAEKGGKYPFVVRGFHGKASDDAFIGIGLILEGTGIKK